MRSWLFGFSILAFVVGQAPIAGANTPEATDPTIPNPPAVAPADPASPSAPAETAATPSEPLIGADVRAKLAAPPKQLSDAEKQDWLALSAFLDSRKDEPMWTGPSGLTAKAEAASAEIGKAQDWGLDARDFEAPRMALEAANGPELPRADRADAEMKLSLAVLKYARYARGGRITEPAKQLSSYLDRLPQLIEPRTVLEQIVASPEPDAYLRSLHPKHPQFEKLRQKYLEMRKTALETPSIVKIPPGSKLVPGRKNTNVALLRKRLGVGLPASAADGTPADESFYDDTLVTAVKAFQQEKGLKPDGIVGANVRAALNDVEIASPERLLANMEQWRWMPDDMGDMYVWVNIPEFLVRVVKGGEIIHEERVITGLPDKQTPVFSDEMELVTFHPRWIIPDSIKVRELYPSLARGGTSFGRQNLRMSYNGRPVDAYEVDWSVADIRRYDIYQPSGPGNALGLVKFSFPNKHAVYMHDTPTKGLFNEASRAFSHGCMRVRNPAKLAEIVLGADKGWDAAKVDGLMNDGAGDENPVTLDHKIPVHITYFTAWVGADGQVQTWKDIYGHEQRIKLALEGKFDRIVRGPDHLAPVTYGNLRSVASSKSPTLDGFFSNFFGGF